MLWTVFPSPISSARIPLIPCGEKMSVHQKPKTTTSLLRGPDGPAHLLIKVSQPVHSLELVALQFAIEDGGLWDVIASVDGGVGEAVALSEP